MATTGDFYLAVDMAAACCSSGQSHGSGPQRWTVATDSADTARLPAVRCSACTSLTVSLRPPAAARPRSSRPAGGRSGGAPRRSVGPASRSRNWDTPRRIRHPVGARRFLEATEQAKSVARSSLSRTASGWHTATLPRWPILWSARASPGVVRVAAGSEAVGLGQGCRGGQAVGECGGVVGVAAEGDR